MTTTELSTVEFEVCWSLLDLGELPLVLDMPSAGRTPEERRGIIDRVLDGLRRRDLADHRGLRPELADRVTGLARFGWAVDTRIITTESLVRARAAAAGQSRGVLAVHEAERVTLRAVPAQTLITEIIALAGPETNSGRIESVSVRTDSLDSAAAVAGGDLRALTDGLVGRGERPGDARTLAHLCRDAYARGQFSLVPSGAVVGFHDTPLGRFLHLRRDGWVTFAPAGNGRLATRVRELVHGQA
jgi:hypothetical protein